MIENTTTLPFHFRLATPADAEFLVGLRTPGSSRTDVTVEGTRAWIAKEDPNRLLLIAYRGDSQKPIGSVRSDFRDGAYGISYYIDKEDQGKGYGKQMVQEFVLRYHKFHPLRFVIKKGNTASEKIAEWFRATPVSTDGEWVTWFSEAPDPAMS